MKQTLECERDPSKSTFVFREWHKKRLTQILTKTLQFPNAASYNSSCFSWTPTQWSIKLTLSKNVLLTRSWKYLDMKNEERHWREKKKSKETFTSLMTRDSMWNQWYDLYKEDTVCADLYILNFSELRKPSRENSNLIF